MRDVIRPTRLAQGDTVGVVSPAAAFSPANERAFRRGVAYLEGMGLHVRVAGHALQEHLFLVPPAAQRADDLNACLTDAEIKAIFCLSGGWGANAVLPLLDWPAIERSPKIVMGYSAITALLIGIYARTGMTTFYGPMLLDGLSEYPELFPYTRQQIERILFTAAPPGKLAPPATWTDDYPKDDQPREMNPNSGWHWLRPGTASGPLVGGHLHTLLTLVGTPYWPSFEGAILFLEEVNMGGTVLMQIEESLAQCRQIGLFDAASGLAMGKVNNLSTAEEQLFEELIRTYTAGTDLPILAGVDLGHTDPRLILPIGARASLDANRDWFSLDEAAVIDT
jgi:muramoyltetrapeptide carboxypeptidase